MREIGDYGIEIRDLRRWQLGGYTVYRRVSFKLGRYGAMINYGRKSIQ